MLERRKPKRIHTREKKQWFKDTNGYYYFSSFGSTMPELNFDNQATRDAILDVALYWMSFGLDGFRLDAVKHIYMANENGEHSDWIVKDSDEANDADYSFDMNKDSFLFCLPRCCHQYCCNILRFARYRNYGNLFRCRGLGRKQRWLSDIHCVVCGRQRRRNVFFGSVGKRYGLFNEIL